jgi:hypothetical protein
MNSSYNPVESLHQEALTYSKEIKAQLQELNSKIYAYDIDSFDYDEEWVLVWKQKRNVLEAALSFLANDTDLASVILDNVIQANPLYKHSWSWVNDWYETPSSKTAYLLEQAKYLKSSYLNIAHNIGSNINNNMPPEDEVPPPMIENCDLDEVDVPEFNLPNISLSEIDLSGINPAEIDSEEMDDDWIPTTLEDDMLAYKDRETTFEWFESALEERNYSLALYFICMAHKIEIDQSSLDRIDNINTLIKALPDLFMGHGSISYLFLQKIILLPIINHAELDSASIYTLYANKNIISNFTEMEKTLLQEYKHIDFDHLFFKSVMQQEHEITRHLLETKKVDLKKTVTSYFCFNRYGTFTGPQFEYCSKRDDDHVAFTLTQFLFKAAANGKYCNLNILFTNLILCIHQDPSCLLYPDSKGKHLGDYFHEMKCKRFSNEDQEIIFEMEEFLQRQYRGHTIDLVIAFMKIAIHYTQPENNEPTLTSFKR